MPRRLAAAVVLSAAIVFQAADPTAFQTQPAPAARTEPRGLVVFGSVTDRDPRSLGESECSGFELGLARSQVRALQQVAFDELVAAGAVTPSPPQSMPAAARRCAAGR